MSYKFIKFNRISALFVISILFFIVNSGCRTYEICECVKDNIPSLDLRWGDIDTLNKIQTEYLIESNGKLFKTVNNMVSLENNDNEQKNAILGYMDCTNYCKLVKYIKNSMIRTQVIQEPGEQINYIVYIDSRNQIYWKAQWCPKFATNNSKFLRQIYDSISVYVSLVK